jgi:phage terminase small subunit
LNELTPKQQRFCEEYIVDLNATQAAIRAGYSVRTAEVQGPRLLSNARVRNAIQVAMDARSERTEITADRVLTELAKIGFSDIRRAVRWGGSSEGETEGAASVLHLVDSAELDDNTAAAVAEVTQTAQGLRLKLHDKRAALVDIGRHLGMFIDRTEQRGAVVLEVITGVPSAEG